MGDVQSWGGRPLKLTLNPGSFQDVRLANLAYRMAQRLNVRKNNPDVCPLSLLNT